MAYFSCPYLRGDVELTNERERHITERHPDLLPEHRERIADTLADPDQGRRSARSAQAQLFVRWFDHVRSGKHVVVIVVTDTASADRHWIITAYLARELTEGEPEWTRN